VSAREAWRHTPGPWRVSKRDPSFVERGSVTGIATIARTFDPSRANSDAHLIAAAPAMRDALEALLLERESEGYASAPTCVAARSALALARGEGGAR
jgi:hypothetical protein